MEIQSLGGIRPPEGGGVSYPCRVPKYMSHVVIYGLAMPAPRPFRGVNLYLHKLIAWAQIVAESKFPPFVSCCRFPVLQIRVVSSPCSPLSMQLEPVTHFLVFDVVNTTTIQGLGIRPTRLLTLLLHYFCLYLHFCYFLPVVLCCPAVSCGIYYLDRPPPLVLRNNMIQEIIDLHCNLQ